MAENLHRAGEELAVADEDIKEQAVAYPREFVEEVDKNSRISVTAFHLHVQISKTGASEARRAYSQAIIPDAVSL